VNRAILAEDLRAALERACPGSSARLRGSLSTGTADEFSDIDLLWVVPDQEFARCAHSVPAVLGAVTPIASLRSDPDFGRSGRRRLLFVRFTGLPLFWRLDLDIRSASQADNDEPDPAGQGGEWSLPESAAMNAIAAVKAIRRGKSATADELLTRGYERIDSTDPGGAAADRIRGLAFAAARQQSDLTALAAEIDALVDHHLGPQSRRS
jgi:hypothetical protein